MNSPNELPVSRVTRPFYWSVWREVWENYSIWIAPSIVSAIIICGSLAGAPYLPERRRNAMLLDDLRRHAAIETPYDIAAVMLIITAFIVGLFYCLDALHGERRDRSILFWKSLPVSDVTTVLSKATVPMLVLPLVCFVSIVITQLVMLVISTAVLAPSGLAGTTFANLNIAGEAFRLFYGLIAISLWHAPIYGWALLVSGWARRATLLCAVLPPLGIAFFEKVTFNTTHFASIIADRIAGFAPRAFAIAPHTVPQMTPASYFSSLGLWGGMLLAVAFITAAIRLRRYRGPL